MDFGGIELGGSLGGYQIINKAIGSSMPQDLATAWEKVNSNILGATYEPLWLVGKQLVNGINYLVLAKEIRITATIRPMIVGMVINIPASQGEPKIVSITEEAQLSDELSMIFEQATKQLLGCSYKPIIYVGSQVVKGINHYYLCEAKAIYPDAIPYPVLLCVNVFEKQVHIVSIERI